MNTLELGGVQVSAAPHARAFGFVWIGERPTRLRVAGVLATVAGVVLVSR